MYCSSSDMDPMLLSWMAEKGHAELGMTVAQSGMQQPILVFKSSEELEKGLAELRLSIEAEIYFWVRQSIYSSNTGPDGLQKPDIRAVIIQHQNAAGAHQEIQILWIPRYRPGRLPPLFIRCSIGEDDPSPPAEHDDWGILLRSDAQGTWEIPWEITRELVRDQARKTETNENLDEGLKDRMRDMAKELGG